MAGAIAGTAILKTNNLTDKLNTITLTINNECNMHCPHCYLQFKSNNFLISDNTLNSIFKSDFDHIVIVGQEPLFNLNSINIVSNIVKRAKAKGITASIVTNGLNLVKLPKNIISSIDYIDVSFDGGEISYQNFRKSSFKRVIEGINYVRENGIREINALHTICDKTIDYLEDCLNIREHARFTNIMFSPYLVTENYGINNVSSLALLDLVELLINNKLFMAVDEAFLLIDNYHLKQDEIIPTVIEKIIREKNIDNKIRLYKHDPLLHGVLRVTYDDLILTPENSLHTKRYKQAIYHASSSDLNKIYQEMLINEFEHAF